MGILIMHFLHGYIPKYKSRETTERIRGGLLGGHIFFQVEGNIYGFEPQRDDDFHIFPRRKAEKFNSRYKKEVLSEWQERMQGKLLSSFKIPMKDTDYALVKTKLQNYSEQAPYDYAFFGMRCASSAHNLLADTSLFAPSGKLKSILSYPYPRRLRKKLLKKALRENWKVSKSEGSGEMIWETDGSMHFSKALKAFIPAR